MAEQDRIVAELKRELRAAGITYRAVAQRLSLSEASVKRLFSSGDFSLRRVDEICELIGIDLSDVLERSHRREAPTNQLSHAQEEEIVSDPKLLFILWLVLLRTPCEEIVASYRFTAREVQQYFIRLDRLKVLELQPGNRVRLLVSRHFSWRPGGAVQRYIHQKLLREFFASAFTGAAEEFFFHGGRVSAAALGRLKRVLRDTSRECTEIMEQDQSAPERKGAAFVLALRPWNFSGFDQFDREISPGPKRL